MTSSSPDEPPTEDLPSSSIDSSAGETSANEPNGQPLGWLIVGVLSAVFLFPVVGLVKTTLFVPEPIEEIGAIPNDENNPSPEAGKQIKALQDGARKENIHNLLAYCGGLLAVVFGIWAVMSTEGPSWRWCAPLLGLVIAVFAPALILDRLITTEDELLVDRTGDLVKPLIMHTSAWAAIAFGAVVSVAIGAGLGSFIRIIVAVVIGAILGGLTYSVGLGLIDPVASTNLVLPADGIGRILWLSTSAYIGLMMWRLSTSKATG